jgi:pyruvate/2-oxoglutarate dehydrogenase complex dihydrolipoamide acyltransferase (E2) component
MPVEILVPPLSQTMDTLVLREWVKKVGDPVVKGEILYRVETDKATLEIEAPATGTLLHIYAQAEEEVKVLSSIGQILEPGEIEPQTQPTAAPEAAGAQGAPVLERTLGKPTVLDKTGRGYASPRARWSAAQASIKLDDYKGQGSGPQKVIIAKDINAFMSKPQPAAPVSLKQKNLPRARPLRWRAAWRKKPGWISTRSSRLKQAQSLRAPMWKRLCFKWGQAKASPPKKKVRAWRFHPPAAPLPAACVRASMPPRRSLI